jgi:hypothetical protein
MVRQLLAERIGKAGEAPRSHADAKVAALDIAGADLCLRADYPAIIYPYYYAGRVPPRRVDSWLAVVLLDDLAERAIRAKARSTASG